MYRIKYYYILVFFLMVAGCVTLIGPSAKTDPFYKSFYEKARLIMSKWEKQVYMYLPDVAAKRNFIIDFWKKRDPTPETENINETRNEFYRRVAWSNRWLHDGSNSRGWDSDRGRILIQLGPPEHRFMDYFRQDGSLSKYIPTDTWFYSHYGLKLVFVDKLENGTFRLINHPVNLISSIDIALNNWGLSDPDRNREAIKFRAKYKDGCIEIKIPVKNIEFKESKYSASISYRADIDVYLDMKKIDTFAMDFGKTIFKKILLKAEYCIFRAKYEVKQKGRYHFDILLSDRGTGQKYRLLLKHKER